MDTVSTIGRVCALNPVLASRLVEALVVLLNTLPALLAEPLAACQ